MMTDYRMVARHVRYWRGQIHKWSTVYPFTGTLATGSYASAIAALKTAEQAVNYKGNLTVAGGLYEIALYDHATGGIPVAVATYFDWTTPGSWVAYTGSAYASNATPVEGAAEVALQVYWPAGLSSSGKPVRFRKWYHAVPSGASAYTAADIAPADQATVVSALTTMTAAISGLGAPMGRGSRLAATTPVVLPKFGNHQMPRGRRKPATRISSDVVHLPPGLLIVPGSDGSLDA